MKNLRFVTAKPSDLDGLMDLEKKCFKHKEDQFSRSSLRHLMTAKTCKTILIKNHSHEIVGEVIGLLRHFKIPSGRVYKIGVSPSLQKKGVGSELLRRIEKWFRKMDMVKSFSEIRISNKASIRMFEKANYKHFKTVKGYYVGGEDAVKYWKKL